MSTAGFSRKVRLGDDVMTHCGRCKEERTHQVVALNSQGGIERVTCRTCQSDHLYRERLAKAKRASASGTRRAQTKEPEQLTGPQRSYSPRETYQPGDLVSHPKFGLGKVLEVRQGKIDVRFNGELRTLLHQA
ncbi:MAG TPA: hypothetical protein VF723_02940 [Pyrinomonadaceae bacterium]|jgi:hypothetical protein